MSRFSDKTPHFSVELESLAKEICSGFLQIFVPQFSLLRKLLASKTRALLQTTPFKVWWRIVFLITITRNNVYILYIFLYNIRDYANINTLRSIQICIYNKSRFFCLIWIYINQFVIS